MLPPNVVSAEYIYYIKNRKRMQGENVLNDEKYTIFAELAIVYILTSVVVYTVERVKL